MTVPLSPADVEFALAVVGAEPGWDGCRLLVELEPPRVLWANQAAVALFGTADRLTLGRMVFGRSAEARPMTTRLARLEPGTPPRLEGIQVAARFSRALVVFKCRAVPGRSPKMILLESARATQGQARSIEPAPFFDLHGSEPPDAHGVAGNRILPTESSPATAVSREATPVVRFTWRTDGSGRLAHVGAEMQAALGPSSLQVGDVLEERLRGMQSEAALAAAEALASGRSWSCPHISWPVDGAGEVQVSLGGTPAPAGNGYRGFGLIENASPTIGTAAPVAGVGEDEDGTEPAGVASAADPIEVEPARGETIDVEHHVDTEAMASTESARPSLEPDGLDEPAHFLTTPLADRDADPADQAQRPAPAEPAEIDLAPADVQSAGIDVHDEHGPGDRVQAPPVASHAHESTSTGPLSPDAEPGQLETVGDTAPATDPTQNQELLPTLTHAGVRDLSEEADAPAAEAAMPLEGEAAAHGAPPIYSPPLDFEPRNRVPPFPAPIQSTGAKVVHLASFKTGLPVLSGKASIRREPPPRPTEDEPDPASLEPPQWAEAPSGSAEAGSIDQRLSSHERFNFDEIARALAALPISESSTERFSPNGPGARAGETGPPASSSVDVNARIVLDSIALGLLVCRGEQLLFANRAVLDLLGYGDLPAFERAGGVGRLFEAGRASLTGQGQITALRRQDGTEIPVDAQIRKITWDGDPATLWSLRSVEAGGPRPSLPIPPVDSRQAGSAADLAEALDLAASGAAFLDHQGRILWISAGAERLLGYLGHDLVGQSCDRLVDVTADVGWTGFFAEFVTGGVNRSAAFRKTTLRKRNGDVVPVGLSLRRTGADRVCLVIQQSTHGHATASELDLLRREAERASALKSEFLAKISHEIRTPLNAMLGFTQIIMEERFGPIGNDRYREYLKDIHSSGSHVVSLVNDLLDLSRIEAGALDLELGPVDVNAVISDCVASFQGQAFRERVIIRTSLATLAPLAIAEERSFRQVVLNLLSNAVKFNEPGGQVILSSAVSDAGRVILRVRDTGSGMSADKIDTALKPFSQLAGPKSTAGTGLGLALTKAMIEACHGTLRIESKLGEGTLVEVTLPRAVDQPVSLPAE